MKLNGANKYKKRRNPALTEIKNRKCGILALKTTYGSNSTKIGELVELRTKSGELWFEQYGKSEQLKLSELLTSWGKNEKEKIKKENKKAEEKN